MNYYELTEETRMGEQGNVFRIRATVRLPRIGVQAGDLGGFICKQTILKGGAWVADDATVIDSYLEGDVLVMHEATVIESKLKEFARIEGRSRLKEVKGYGVMVRDGAEVKRSSLKGKGDVQAGVFVSGTATIIDSQIVHKGGNRIEVMEQAVIFNSEVEGGDYRFGRQTKLENSALMNGKSW